MAATHGIWLMVLVLCLSHGSWSGSARMLLTESKRELSEESNQAAKEPSPPENSSDPGSIKENDNVPLEVVQGSSASPISLGDSDQSACGWIRGSPNCHPNCHAHGCAPLPRPYCEYPNQGCTYYPPQPSPECQPGSYPCNSFYPPQPSPECQPISGPCPSVYPPQPNPNPDCYVPYPGCHTASSPYPGSGYEPQPTPACFNPNPGCANSGYNYPGCANQPNPECVYHPSPECQWGPGYPPHSVPACITPDCQPNSGSAYPPQPTPWCVTPGPGCLNYPQQIDPNHPELPEPFYPPQQESSNSSPGNGPRIVDQQNSLKQENINQSNDEPDVEEEGEGVSIDQQDGSHHAPTPSTT